MSKLPHPSGIDQGIGPRVDSYHTVDRISRCTWGIIHQKPTVAKNPVNERRLPNVRTSNNGNLCSSLILQSHRGCWQSLEDSVEQVSHALTMLGRTQARL